MKIACCAGIALLAGSPLLPAQQQEKGMIDRIWANAANQKLECPMQNRGYTGGDSVRIRDFKSTAYLGIKPAATGAFRPKTFLGLRAPWLGKGEFKAAANEYRSKQNALSETKFLVRGYDTGQFDRAEKKARADAVVPDSLKPRDAGLKPKAQGGVDRLMQNLGKEMTIDEVRQLLNKSR